jgi:hypothetical protein
MKKLVLFLLLISSSLSAQPIQMPSGTGMGPGFAPMQRGSVTVEPIAQPSHLYEKGDWLTSGASIYQWNDSVGTWNATQTTAAFQPQVDVDGSARFNNDMLHVPLNSLGFSANAEFPTDITILFKLKWVGAPVSADGYSGIVAYTVAQVPLVLTSTPITEGSYLRDYANQKTFGPIQVHPVYQGTTFEVFGGGFGKTSAAVYSASESSIIATSTNFRLPYIQTSPTLELGGWDYYAETFNGNIETIAIFDKVLTQRDYEYWRDNL